MKEFIKKIPIVGTYSQKLYGKLFNRPEVFQGQQNDFMTRVEKVNALYGDFYSWKGDGITYQLKKYSAHTRNELAMIKSFIAPGYNIIDIGAHIGTFSIPFSLFTGKQGMVFAFEANPENYKLLKLNILENSASSNIIPHLSIVSNTNSPHKMFLPEEGNSGMYTFLPEGSSLDANVNTTNIDTWYDQNYKGLKIHLIKIDVEGAEISVLESCQNIIRKHKPILYIEINESALGLFGRNVEDIEHLLQMEGYQLYRNSGERNSNNDIYKLTRLKNLKEGGIFFDVLAIHPSSPKYPDQTD